MRSICLAPSRAVLALFVLLSLAGFELAQLAPPASGARILLLPRKLISGERATLAVLDVNGRLTPGVEVQFSDGENVTTDATGRALFVAPLNAASISAAIAGRAGRVSSRVSPPGDVPAGLQVVTGAPRAASLSDRFELAGEGFCGDADANHVTIGGLPGLVLASSPVSLAVLPPAELEAGPAQVKVSCGQKAAKVFTMVFVSLELEAKTGTLAPGERRSLAVRVRGTTGKINLEARNLSGEVADLTGGAVVRVTSNGGTENVAKFEVVGKKTGNFIISIRLLAPLMEPRP